MIPQTFNATSYKQNNKTGIDIVSDYLRGRGWIIPERVEDYGVDIIATKYTIKKRVNRPSLRKDCIQCFEVEMKRCYFTDEYFPYKTVSFLGRKKKYGKFWYVIVSRKSDYALAAYSDTIYNPKYHQKKVIETKSRIGYDDVYHVPVDKVTFFKIR